MNILIVEDHRSFKEGVELFLSQFPEYELLSAGDGKQALNVLNGAKKIDIIITDLNLPEMNGFEMIENVRTKFPEIKIIVLTMYYNKNIVKKLKTLNVNGFLTKNISLSEIKDAITKANEDKCYITREIISLFQDHEFSSFQDKNFAKTFCLSPRELDILDLMVENKTNQEIANAAFISPETVKSHRKNIYRKLGVNNILDLYKLLVANKYV
jgi:DNA-binding NarL/FixJ family response regulator